MKKWLIIIIIVVLIIGGTSLYFYLKPSPESDHQPTVPLSDLFSEPCVEIGCNVSDIYAGSINSDKYYECDCRYAKNINPENVVCFATDAEAIAENRVKSEC